MITHCIRKQNHSNNESVLKDRKKTLIPDFINTFPLNKKQMNNFRLENKTNVRMIFLLKL